jgi:hypothetical protein
MEAARIAIRCAVNIIISLLLLVVLSKKLSLIVSIHVVVGLFIVWNMFIGASDYLTDFSRLTGSIIGTYYVERKKKH